MKTKMTEMEKDYNYDCAVVRVETPDGSLFVVVVEDTLGEPMEVHLSLGKTGTTIRAWTEAVQACITLLLKTGTRLEDIINLFTNVTTGKLVYHAGVFPIKSGPEGLAHALKIYIAGKVNVPEFRGMNRLPKLNG